MASYFSSLRKAVVLYLCFGIATAPMAAEQAEMRSLMPSPESNASLPRGSVYVYGDPSLDNLIPIRVLGGVNRAGIHYVPSSIDLLSLIALAGGFTEKAELDEIVIKREQKGKKTVLRINLEDLTSDEGGDVPKMQANDTLIVPQEKMFISENLSRTVTFVAGIATVILTVLVSIDQLKD